MWKQEPLRSAVTTGARVQSCMRGPTRHTTKRIAICTTLVAMWLACEDNPVVVSPAVTPVDSGSGVRPLLAIRTGEYITQPGSEGTVWAIWSDGTGLCKYPLFAEDSHVEYFVVSPDAASKLAESARHSLLRYENRPTDTRPLHTDRTTLWIADGNGPGHDVTTILGFSTTDFERYSALGTFILLRNSIIFMDGGVQPEHLSRHQGRDLTFVRDWKDFIFRVEQCCAATDAALPIRERHVVWNR